ncbi:MAG: tetratricopeptide repeat protein [Planctomycetales bacterium]
MPLLRANMKGKPGQSKPVASAKVATRTPTPSKPVKARPLPAKPAPAPTPAKPQTPARPTAPVAGDSDDPFAIVHDTSKAIPISPRQTGRFTDPIVCPMCETAGFIPPQARGRDVRCSNPKCMAPVFMAPKNLQPPQATRQEAPAVKKSNTPLIASVVAVVVLAGGGLTYWFVLKEKPKAAAAPVFVPATPTQDVEPVIEDIVGPVHKPKPAEEKERTVQQALDGLSALALRDENIRVKALGCRLATVAFVLTGNEKRADEFLTQLKSVASATPHYQIEPLIKLAWLKHSQGKKDEAAKLVKEALELAPKIPTHGRDASDLSIQLAAGLAAIGDIEQAHKLLEEHLQATGSGYVSAAESIARDIGTFDIDLWLPGSMIGGWESPQRVATIVKLIHQNLPNEARQLIGKAKSPRAKLESGIAFLEATLLLTGLEKGEPAAEQLRNDLKSLPPAAQALLDLHTASLFLRQGKQDAAAPLLERAKTTLSSLPIPKPLEFKSQDYKTFLAQTPPDFEPLEMQALADAEYAVVQRRLGQHGEALKWGQNSLAVLRATTFSLERLRNAEAEISSQGSARFQQTLKTLFKLGSIDEARRKASEVNRQIASWKETAERRQTLQLLVLWELVDQTLAPQIKQEVERLSRAESLSDRENFLKSALMVRLEAPTVETPQQPLSPFLAHSPKTISSQYLWSKRQEILHAVRDKQFEQAIALIAGIATNEDSDYWITRLMNRLMREQSGASAAKAVQRISSSDLKERLARLLSAQAIALGQGNIAWEVAETSSTPITIRLNTQEGIVEGLTRHPPAETGKK